MSQTDRQTDGCCIGYMYSSGGWQKGAVKDKSNVLYSAGLTILLLVFVMSDIKTQIRFGAVPLFLYLFRPCLFKQWISAVPIG